MKYFSNFINSLRTVDNTVVLESILEGYSCIYGNMMEGKSDIDNLSVYKNKFNQMMQLISRDANHDNIQLDIDGLTFGGDALDIPYIWFAITPMSVNGTIDHENAITGFNELAGTIRIDITDNRDAFRNAVKINDLNTIVGICKDYKDAVIHELVHFKDSQYKGNRQRVLHSHKSQKTQCNGVLTALNKLNISDIDYYGKQTERNAYITQYIWKCIESLIKTKRYSITFDEFIKPLKESEFYTHALHDAKKRILKRLYYFWVELQKALPDMVLFTDVDIDEFYDNFIKALHTPNIDDTKHLLLHEALGEILCNYIDPCLDCGIDNKNKEIGVSILKRNLIISNHMVLLDKFIIDEKFRVHHYSDTDTRYLYLLDKQGNIYSILSYSIDNDVISIHSINTSKKYINLGYNNQLIDIIKQMFVNDILNEIPSESVLTGFNIMRRV